MSLLVNNVVSATSQINYSYLSNEQLFGYLINLNYVIKVEDIRFDNNDGVLLAGRVAIREAYKRKNITARIAGDEILNGLITNVSFPESSLTGEDIVNVSIEERRRLNDYSSDTFAKYIPNPHLLNDFVENYDFQRSGSTYSYSRSISIQYVQDAGDQFLDNAKVFLTNYYFENRPAIGYYADGISENAKFNKKYNGNLNETIDLVNLTVSLEENFESSFISHTENVSKDITTSLSVDESGFLSKEVSVDLTALRYDSQNVLEEAISSTIDQIISQEESEFGKPHSIQKGITQDSKSANITLVFSSDPKKSQENYITYNCVKKKNGAFFVYDLTVEYKAKGENNRQKYDNVISLWTSARDKNKIKVSGLFSEATSIYEKSRSAVIDKNMGSVRENISFSTDDSYDSVGLPAGIIKFKIEVSKQDKVKRSSVVLDLVNLKQKLVTSNLNKLGSATVTATALSEQSFGQFHAKEFLNSKTSEMNASLGEATYYATSDQVSTDLANGTTTRVINYIIA